MSEGEEAKVDFRIHSHLFFEFKYSFGRENTSNILSVSAGEKILEILIFFFCWLKLSMMTPINRFKVKKDPKMMKITK
jgi:hypothetical protein